MYKLGLLIFYTLSFLSCGSNIEFSVPEDEIRLDCLVKEIEGEEICVIEKTEIFDVKNFQDKTIDFLFILDVSPSMTDDLARLGDAFSGLMSQIKESKWRIFFTTADHGDHEYTETEDGILAFSQDRWQDYQQEGPYFGNLMFLEHQGKKLDQKVLSVKVPEYNSVFKDTLTSLKSADCSQAPYCQGSLEQPLRVLNSTLERFSKSSTIKETESLISFIITDEDERKEELEQATKAETVVGNFKSLFPKKSLYSFSIIIQDEECLASQRKYSAHSVLGTRISKLAPLAHGKNISICEESFVPALNEISKIVRRLVGSFKLSEKPLSKASVKVEFLDKKQPPVKWHLEGKRIIFEQPLELNSKVKVTYFLPSSKESQSPQLEEVEFQDESISQEIKENSETSKENS